MEYRLFRLIESRHVLPQLGGGFESVEDFIRLANSVTNRRKSRAGRSLELHLARIFDESGLAGRYSPQCETKGRTTADFVFPSCEQYHDPQYPERMLHMLAVKTTCKDRWRQILTEADRIPSPHLFTLQEGVSLAQFDEMKSAGVRLVVPLKLHTSYTEALRPELISLDRFIDRMVQCYVTR